MAQTTGGMSFKNCKVEFSTDNTTWTDASGYANQIEVSGGERATEDTMTFDGDTPFITTGKRAGLDVTMHAVHTETVGEAYRVAETAYEAGSAFYIRWSPKGGSSTNRRYTSSAGVVTQCVYPTGEGTSAASLMTTVQIHCASVTAATI